MVAQIISHRVPQLIKYGLGSMHFTLYPANGIKPSEITFGSRSGKWTHLVE